MIISLGCCLEVILGFVGCMRPSAASCGQLDWLVDFLSRPLEQPDGCGNSPIIRLSYSKADGSDMLEAIGQFPSIGVLFGVLLMTALRFCGLFWGSV